MPGNLTRKELKQDNVALNVEKTFDFVNLHKKGAVRIAGAVLALVLIVAAVIYYRSSQQDVREQMLGDAITLQSAPVGAAQPNGAPSFPSEAAKQSAVTKAYEKLLSEHSGSPEAYVAEYSLAAMNIQAGKLDDARKQYQDVVDHANANYSSLAKLALAQLDFAGNRTADAQSLLKDLQDHPTDLVSKNQATYVLARGLMPTNPAESRKLLMQLAGSQSEISSVAVSAMNDLPAK